MNRLILIALCTLIVGCNTPLEDPNSIDPEMLLQLTTESDSILSGGTSKTVVTARVPKQAGVFDITFSATAGNFVQVNAKTIKQLTDSLADPYRFAFVIFASDATKGDVYITAEAKSSRKRIKIVFY